VKFCGTDKYDGMLETLEREAQRNIPGGDSKIIYFEEQDFQMFPLLVAVPLLANTPHTYTHTNVEKNTNELRIKIRQRGQENSV
jgi:hypothetical protein